MAMTTLPGAIGTQISEQLVQQVGQRKFAMWFDRASQFEYRPDRRTLDVHVPNQFVAQWIDRHFRPALESATRHAVGGDHQGEIDIAVHVAPERFAQQETQRSEANRAEVPAAQRPRPPRSREDRALLSGSNLRHRLEDFVVGRSNQLAFAAAQRLADASGEQRDAAGHPLFVHGGCGLGKTHLLQGICRRMLEHEPDARVLYTTGEQFTNAYITAVRTNKLEAFRRSVRRLDLLAVDDVHFIANKAATQQEFLHSFDEIELTGSRVVLASDSHPKLIEQFSEALISRCVRGLVVEIQPPDLATREHLIEVLARRKGLMLQEKVASTLSAEADGSVRDIEGMLTKLHALATLSQPREQRVTPPGPVRVGMSLLAQLLNGHANARSSRPLRFETIRDAVCQEMGVSAQSIAGANRHRTVVLARAAMITLVRDLTSMSYPEIAAAMGKRNHSTVITAAQRMQRLVAEDQPLPLPDHLQAMTASQLLSYLRRRITQR